MENKVKEILREINAKEISFKISDYCFHRDVGCNGKFSLVLNENYLHFGFTFGPTVFNKFPIIQCNKCESGFVPKEFSSYIEKFVALYLLITDGFWTKSQTKFLREFFEKTQTEMAEILALSGKHEISRRESQRFNNCVFSKVEQFYLRKYYIGLVIKQFHPSKKIINEINGIVMGLPMKENLIEINKKFLPSWNEIEDIIHNSSKISNIKKKKISFRERAIQKAKEFTKNKNNHASVLCHLPYNIIREIVDEE